MKRFLVLLMLTAIASAQAVSSQFTGEGSLPPASIKSETSLIAAGPNAYASLPDLLPKPQGKTTLIGGTVAKIDRVRDEIVIKVFGGGTARVLFDSRTHINRDDATASMNAIQDGNRIYVDTRMAGKDIFAQNIRVVTQAATGQSMGQVVSYNAKTGDLTVSDAIFPRKIALHVQPDTQISRDGANISANELLPGSLVSLGFQSGRGQPVVRQITILAAPGNAFVFVGHVTHLDLHTGSLVVVDPRDEKSYDISFDPSAMKIGDDLREGATVEVTTTFNGRQYMASAIKVDSNSRP
jgi:hypothetical protein